MFALHHRHHVPQVKHVFVEELGITAIRAKLLYPIVELDVGDAKLRGSGEVASWFRIYPAWNSFTTLAEKLWVIPKANPGKDNVVGIAEPARSIGPGDSVGVLLDEFEDTPENAVRVALVVDAPDKLVAVVKLLVSARRGRAVCKAQNRRIDPQSSRLHGRGYIAHSGACGSNVGGNLGALQARDTDQRCELVGHDLRVPEVGPPE